MPVYTVAISDELSCINYIRYIKYIEGNFLIFWTVLHPLRPLDLKSLHHFLLLTWFWPFLGLPPRPPPLPLRTNSLRHPLLPSLWGYKTYSPWRRPPWNTGSTVAACSCLLPKPAILEGKGGQNEKVQSLLSSMTVSSSRSMKELPRNILTFRGHSASFFLTAFPAFAFADGVWRERASQGDQLRHQEHPRNQARPSPRPPAFNASSSLHRRPSLPLKPDTSALSADLDIQPPVPPRRCLLSWILMQAAAVWRQKFDLRC